MKKTASLLIAFLMLISLMPFSALAYEIGNVNVSVTEPQVGKTPDFNVSLIDINNENLCRIDTADNSNGMVNGVGWYNKTDGKYMTSSDRFETGKEYTINVRIEPNSGHKFALDTSVGIRSSVHGYMNSKSANVRLASDSTQEIYVSKTYTLASNIETVEIKDIIAPVAGMNPEYDGMVGDESYKLMPGTYGNFVNGMYWFDITDSKLLAKEDTFVEGHKYRIFLCLTVSDKEKNKFAVLANGNPSVKAYVNSESANAMKYLNESAEEIINVYYDFPACEKPVIYNIKIENVVTPSAGKNPEYVANANTKGVSLVQTDNTFSHNGVSWTNVNQNYDMTSNGFFLSGLTYKVNIRVRRESGYAFDENMTATVNGQNASVSVAGAEATISYQFICPDYEISKVGINNIEVPSIGKNPSYTIGYDEPNLYEIKSDSDIGWYVDDTLMDKTDKFIAGKNYDVVIYLAPRQEDGIYVATFAKTVSATVNGNAVSTKKIERLSESNIKITYTFTAAASAEIGAVDIIGIDVPVSGKSPDYTAELPNSDTYMIDTSVTDKSTSKGVTWRNVTANRVMTVGTEKFEKGNVYEVMVRVTPQKGYKFVTKADGTPNIDGTINGNVATDIMGRSDVEAIIVYKFPVTEDESPENSGQKEENIDKPSGTDKPSETDKPSDTDKPSATDKPSGSGGGNGGGNSGSGNPGQDLNDKNKFSDVLKGTYYFDAVMWASEEGITGGTSDTTFSPDAGCTRAQVVTFLWRMVASPEPELIDNPFSDVAESAYYYKPVMWALDSKITGGTSDTTFSPDTGCTRAQVVTFLYRCAGQPEAKANNNPFDDVTQDSYYYKAVLWAVENGITGGTSDTTFSPDTGCTRAQVVTFLYRFINGN